MAYRHTEERQVTFGGLTFPCEVVRSARRRKTVAIRVEAGVVQVQAPLGEPWGSILGLLERRAGWIAGRLSVAAERQAVAFADGGEIPFLGKKLVLVTRTGGRRRVAVSAEAGSLTVCLPSYLDAEEGPDAVEHAVRRWLRAAAAAELSDCAAKWSAEMGVTPRGVMVRDQRHRWGSCAPDGTLRLNWRLVLLDPRLIDYVVVHELCHLRRRDHSPAFWAEVARWLPDHRARRASLRAVEGRLPM